MRMLARASDTVAPIDTDDELRAMALQMPHASLRGSVVYHLGRYGEDGLFHGADPADQPFRYGEVSLKQQFQELASVRNALVVAARIRRES